MEEYIYILNNILQTKNNKFKYTITKHKKINLIFIFFIIIFLFPNEKKYSKKLLKAIKQYEKNTFIRTKEIKEFKNINIKSKMIQRKHYNKNYFPDISVIVTVYNQADCINKCLKSILNQSLQNLEIIIIDDCSLDNSIDIIESYKNEDDRIILIKHDLNLGKIKTRTDGIKLAKGKYITIIDGDDSFIHKDILKNSLHIANLADLDVVEFGLSEFKNGKLYFIHNNFYINRIIYQPELSRKFIIIKNEDSKAIINRSICAKLIKNDLFQKLIYYIGKKYTEDYILVFEDTIMAFGLFNIANSYYLMKEQGYYYSRNQKKVFNFTNKIKKCKSIKKKNDIDALKFLEFLFEKSQNNKNSIQMIYHEIISEIKVYLNNYKYNNDYLKEIYRIFDNLIKNSNLKQKQKNKLIKIKMNLLKIKQNYINVI